MEDSSKEEVAKAFESIEKSSLTVNGIVCSECECVVNINDESSKPCDHLVEMFKDWKEI